jgi:hypothetical protein
VEELVLLSLLIKIGDGSTRMLFIALADKTPRLVPLPPTM